MSFSFLAPAFLAALGALAVPVIIHLMHRERRAVVPFPSLMFLRRIPYRSVRRQKLRHWLLFALRCAALILLAAAFARPFIDRPAAAASASGSAREVVILLDHSYSMGYGTRWTRALDAARRAVDGLTPADRATIILFADDAAAATQATSDHTILRAALGAARLSSGGTDYAPALRLTRQILAASPLPRRELVMISDFQRSGWSGDQELKLPAGATLATVALSDSTTANVAVVGAELDREFTNGRERVAVTARLANRSASAVSALPVALESDGRQLETRAVSLPANGSASITFSPFAIPSGMTRGTVRAGGDALPQDNVFHFVLSRGAAVGVLIVDAPDAAASSSLYLSRALRIGDQPSFRVTVRSQARLAASDLDGQSLVILNDAPFPRGAAGVALERFVRGGGGLLVALGEHSAPGGWSGDAAALLPGKFGATVDRLAERGATLGFLDRTHPALSLFAAPRSGDFTTARFFRYRRIDSTRSSGVLARFDDRSAALVEGRAGSGRVLLWGSTFDGVWNDLPLQPVFLPFIQRLASYAAGYTESRPWYTVGQSLELAQYDGTRSAAAGGGAPAPRSTAAMADSTLPAMAVTTPLGERMRLGGSASGSEPTRGTGGSLLLAEQGFYELRRLDGPRAAPATVAVNLDLAESDLTPMDPKELVNAVTTAPSATTAAASASSTPEAQEKRQRLWWYLLVGALLLLALETALSNRLSRSVSAQRTV